LTAVTSGSSAVRERRQANEQRRQRGSGDLAALVGRQLVGKAPVARQQHRVEVVGEMRAQHLRDGAFA
jgi:hypothetical protein